MDKYEEEELKARILGEREMFAYYLEEVLANNLIENPATLGIARLIIDKGAKELTDKQWYTFLRHGVGDINYVPHCRRDYERIPWEEMLSAVYIEEDELCDYCRHKEAKGE